MKYFFLIIISTFVTFGVYSENVPPVRTKLTCQPATYQSYALNLAQLENGEWKLTIGNTQKGKVVNDLKSVEVLKQELFDSYTYTTGGYKGFELGVRAYAVTLRVTTEKTPLAFRLIGCVGKETTQVTVRTLCFESGPAGLEVEE